VGQTTLWKVTSTRGGTGHHKSTSYDEQLALFACWLVGKLATAEDILFASCAAHHQEASTQTRTIAGATFKACCYSATQPHMLTSAKTPMVQSCRGTRADRQQHGQAEAHEHRVGWEARQAESTPLAAALATR
jgi:hypothetical protein